MYIVFEGIDGTGKSQFSKEVAALLQEERLDVDDKIEWMSEPSQGPMGKFIRELFEGKHGDTLPNWRSMFFLFQADAEQSIEKLQAARRSRHNHIISDRGVLSRWVYQPLASEDEVPVGFNEAARAGARSGAQAYVEEMTRHVPRPDLTIVLDGPVDVLLARRGKVPDLFERKDLLERARNRYKLWVETANARVALIDTDRHIEQVRAEIFRNVRQVCYERA